MQLKAGQVYTFKIYTKFDERDLAPHDWSLVLWTDVKAVTIDHVGFFSSGFKVQRLFADTPIPKQFPEQQEEDPVWIDGYFGPPIL